jgi:hypothetical protein
MTGDVHGASRIGSGYRGCLTGGHGRSVGHVGFADAHRDNGPLISMGSGERAATAIALSYRAQARPPCDLPVRW